MRKGHRGSRPHTQQSVSDEKALASDNSSTQNEGPANPDHENVSNNRWSALFSFTKRTHNAVLAGALIATIAAGAVLPIYNIFFGKAIDSFTDYAAGKLDKTSFLHNLAIDCGAIGAIGLATWILDGTCFTLWILFGELQANSCRERLLEGLMEKPMSWYDTRTSGIEALVPRTQAQIHDLQIATSQPLGNAVKALATSLTALGMGFYYSWSMTLVILASLPLCAVMLAGVSVHLQQNIQNQQDHLNTATKQAVNALDAIDTVKYFNSQDVETRTFATIVRRAAAFYVKQANTNAMQRGIAGFIGLCMFTQGFWYGSHLVLKNRLTTAAMVTTIFSVVTATSALQSILPNMLVLEKGKAAGAAMITMLVTEIQPHDLITTKGHIPHQCFGDIAVCGVDFAYPTCPEQYSLVDATCSFKAGSTTFVIGHSGSGKSTLAQLLLKLYVPNRGSILLDGQPISGLDSAWLRENITLVEQQDTLFDGSIIENIVVANQEPTLVTMNDVKDAVQFSLLKETLDDLPDGLETSIGVRGKALSGGQRQRLALARAKVRDTAILILDESTSALDQISRELIMAAVRAWRKGRTTIFITHDISQIVDEDMVCIFHNGRVAEQGYRAELERQQSSAFHTFIVPVNTQLNTATLNMDQPEFRSVNTPVFSMPYNHQSNQLAHSEQRLIPQMFESPLRMNRISQNGFTNFILTRMPDNRLGSRPGSVLAPFPNMDTSWDPAAGITIPTLTLAKSRPVSIAISFLTPQAQINRTRHSSHRWSKDAWLVTQHAGTIAAEKRAKVLQRKHHISEPTQDDNGNAPVPSAYIKFSSFWIILRTVIPELNKLERTRLVLGFVAASVHAGAIPTFSYLVAKLLSTLYERSSHMAMVYSVATLAVAAVDAVASYLSSLNLESCAQVWADGIRVAAMKRILDQPREFFSDNAHTPAILAQTLDRSAEDLRNLLGRFVALIFQAILLMIIGFTWSFTSCWKLAFIGLALVPLPLISTKCFQIFSERFETKGNDAADSIGSILNEVCISIRTVKALTLEDHFRKKYIAASKLAFDIGMQRALLSGLFYGLSEAMPDFYNAVLYYAGGRLVASSACETQGVLTVFTMLLFAVTNLTGVVNFLPQINSAKDSAARLLHLAHALPETSHEHLGTVRLTEIGDIALRRVRFAYPLRPHDAVLRNVNIEFPASSVTAVVGLSGSGKSTIAALLTRLYTLDETSDNRSTTSSGNGRITIGGRSISRLHTPSLRSLIAIVPQSCVLFPGTITYNITYGLAPSHAFATSNSVRAAAEAAGIHDFITSLPNGYDTLVGAGGTTLSGGQTQRLVIARALVRKPSLLILDEATSALDIESTTMIRETVAKLVENSRKGGNGGHRCTVIVITHDKEMMRLAERIVMLENGVVVDEGGALDEMVRKGGRFAELMRGGLWIGNAG